MAEVNELDLKPHSNPHDPPLEEQKFYDFSSTASKTRGMTNPFISHHATTSKKRSREEMGNQMSLYDHAVIGQREAAGNQV